MPRALLSVSDKTGLDRIRERARRTAVSSSSRPAAPPRALQQAGLAGRRYLGRDRVSRDDGRPRQDAPPAGPRRHPGAPRPTPDDLAAAGRHGITLIDLVVVNLYPFVKAAANPGHAVRGAHRGDRHRRPEPGPRRRQELSRTSSSSCRRRTTQRCWTQLDRSGRPAPRLPLRAGAQGVRAHRQLRHGDRVHARDDHRGRRRFRRAARRRARPLPCPSDCTRCATCATARTRTRWRRGTRMSRHAGLGAARCCRARSCRTPTCSISTPRRASCSSSASRRPSSSSTRTRAAPQPAASAADAYVRAREADPLAAFGGIVGLNRPIDAETARAIVVDASSKR